MAEPRKLRIYQYVNRPYERVREAFLERGQEILQRATTSAAARADALAATLRVTAAGIEIGVDVKIRVTRIREEEWVKGASPVTRVSLSWEAAKATALFPSMQAELSLWPLYAEETQLELVGEYHPPLGVVGNALDAMVGHRLAEASTHRFLDDIVEQLRRELPTH
jgi:hypothetical protein